MREMALKIAFAHLGKSWNNPTDFIVEILESVGLVPNKSKWTVNRLADIWQRTRSNVPGDLVFWRKPSGKAWHVEMCIGEGLSIGVEDGFVRVRPIHSRFVRVRPMSSRPKVWGYTDPFGDLK